MRNETVMGRLSNHSFRTGTNNREKPSSPQKTYVVPETSWSSFVMCRTSSITTVFSEGEYDDNNKNELLQHGKTDVDLSLFVLSFG